ncbi:hypothetical protein [Mesorhizobium caraganae]|uniref:hypothetical protein n=1 Tax=Mesorhizobium caraganae TaxID=483206 RepID=UPI00333D2E63
MKQAFLAFTVVLAVFASAAAPAKAEPIVSTTKEQTAMRALDLLGNKRQAPLSASPWRVGDGGTTRAVHACAGDRDCGAQIHAD